MKSVLKKFFIDFAVAASIVFAADVNWHEIDGSKVTENNRAKGPKALVKENRSNIKKLPVSKAVYADYDSFHVALRDSIHWLEMEKNTDYTICTDDVNNGMWKGTDFSFKKENNCVLLNSGNYVKSGKLWYVTNMGNVHTFNLLVGMKYVDLSTKKHLIGTETMADVSYTIKGKAFLRDPKRFEHIDEVLAVDKYKVTECEFIYALWDSIPAQVSESLNDNNNFWIEKKQLVKKNGYCDAHDSAAIRVNLYHAFVYANIRSLRDGFKPVYSLAKTDDNGRSFNGKDGSFNVENTSFFESSLKDEKYIHIEIDKNADGYRLPYYDEWMALARARTSYVEDQSIKDDSSRIARYAWFGIVESGEFYATLNKEKYADRLVLNRSCGEWSQKSRPVGMLQPNEFGLYDILGLVCERTILPGKSIYHNEVSLCKGGFLTSSLDEIKFQKRYCGDDGFAHKKYQGLRLVRQIR